MNTTAKLDRIDFLFSETDGGFNLEGVTAHTFRGANALLDAVHHGNAATTGYYKVDILVTWEDGSDIRVRHDVDGAENDLAGTIRAYIEFQTKFHWTTEEVAAWLKAHTLTD